MAARYNSFDINLTHLSSLASTNAATTVLSWSTHHAARCSVLINVVRFVVLTLGIQAPRTRVKVSDEERCGVCQWLGCPDEDCFGACSKCALALRPMRWQQCRLK